MCYIHKQDQETVKMSHYPTEEEEFELMYNEELEMMDECEYSWGAFAWHTIVWKMTTFQ